LLAEYICEKIMKKEKGKTSNTKTTFGKRRDGKHKKFSGPKEKREKEYKGQGR
jgi:hypothetical protein